MSASSGRRSSTGSSRRRVQSSTSVIAHAATIGFVIEAMRQIVSPAMGVLDPAPSNARLPAASTCTSPWRARTASNRTVWSKYLDQTAHPNSILREPLRSTGAGTTRHGRLVGVRPCEARQRVHVGTPVAECGLWLTMLFSGADSTRPWSHLEREDGWTDRPPTTSRQPPSTWSSTSARSLQRCGCCTAIVGSWCALLRLIPRAQTENDDHAVGDLAVHRHLAHRRPPDVDDAGHRPASCASAPRRRCPPRACRDQSWPASAAGTNAAGGSSANRWATTGPAIPFSQACAGVAGQMRWPTRPNAAGPT
jgi:hypothetical protein